MKKRRGTDLWPGELGRMVHQYKKDDIVVSTLVESSVFTGIVKEVHPKLNKVMVAWGGGSVVQHDPDEIMLHPFTLKKEAKLASRRELIAAEMSGFPIAEFIARFLETYSQLYLFHWQTYGYAQHLAFESANEDLSGLMDGFVESWQGKYGRASVIRALDVMNYEADYAERFVAYYCDFVADCKNLLGESDDDLANIIDEMIARMNKLRYLLTLE